MPDTKDKPKPNKAQKFFFDQNFFDDDYEEEIIEEEPPLPMFSEQELESARKESYDRGRREAMAEAQASREKHIADLVGTISQSFQTLFAAESERQACYEAEAVAVARTIFAKLFPALNDRHGLDETAAMIETTLNRLKDELEIIIEVHPDYKDDITARLETIDHEFRKTNIITVTGNDTLGPGDCRMRWHDGGAQRDISGLTEEIYRQLEHMLADKPLLQDNKEEENANIESESSDQAQEDGVDNTTNGEDQ